jgi:tetratricopeptide (TPR) repeat protein
MKQYQAFISYSHADRKWARWLHRKLESYRPPRQLELPTASARRLRPIFRDRDELPSAASLSKAVESALQRSEWLLVICSPQAAQSQWVNEEIRLFRALGGSDRILCFVVSGEPGSGAADECFPAALIAPETPGQSPMEPIAADARSQGDGRRNALLKIAAGMLGVGFDALRQRDVHRRYRRLVATTAGSALIATATIVLAVTAVIARNEAQDRREQAEDLIDFMLVDLTERLRAIGRLDVYDSISNKALDYFAAQRDGNDTPYTLAQRARNLRQIGEVQMQGGNLDAALAAYEEALHIADRLARQDGAGAQARIDWANSMFYVGHVHWLRGELNEARAIFERVNAIVDGVWSAEPDNPDWLIERAYAHTNLGRVLEQLGDFDQALTAYQVVMAANQRLARLEPGNSEWLLELGFAHNNLGKLLFALGRLDEAEAHYREDLELKRRVHETDRSHNTNNAYFAASHYFLGQLLLFRGDYSEARTLLADAHAHLMHLTQVDSDRTDWKRRLANVERELGLLEALYGDPDLGAAQLQSSTRVLEQLVQGDPYNTAWQRDLTRTLLTTADFAERGGDPQAAKRTLRSAQHHIEALVEQEPSILETQELSIYADICGARLSDGDAAARSTGSALEKLDHYFSDTRDPRILELRAAALAARNIPGATDLAMLLKAMGYRGRQLKIPEGEPP